MTRNENVDNLEASISVTWPDGSTTTTSPGGASTNRRTLVGTCVAYRDSGTAYAVADDGTSYSDSTSFGSSPDGDIFAAIQQYIDDVEAETRESIRGTGQSGFVDIYIRPDYYSTGTSLTVSSPGFDSFSLRSSGFGGAQINTEYLTGDNFAVEIDPGELTSGNFSDKDFSISVRGLWLDHANGDSPDSASDRSAQGIKIEYASWVDVRDCILKAHKRNLFINHSWQGIVDNVWSAQSGSEADGWAGIQVGSSDGTTAFKASNHFTFRHLQGDTNFDFAGEYGYFELKGRVSRMDIEYCNVESMGTNPTLILGRDWDDGSNIASTVNVRGGEIAGEPAVEVGGAEVNIVGARIVGEDDDTGDASVSDAIAMTADGTGRFPFLTIAGCNIAAADVGVRCERGVLTVGASTIEATNQCVLVDGGATDASGGPFASNISHATLSSDSSHAIEFVDFGNRTHSVRACDIYGSGAAPINISNGGTVLAGGINAWSGYGGSVIESDDSTLMYYGILPQNSLTGAHTDNGGTTLETFNSS